MPGPGSTLSPLGHRQFLILWMAGLAANSGNAVQAVGAAWLMTAIDGRADMIGLVQTATSLPMMLFALVGGVVADLHDRRRVLLVAYGAAAGLSGLLAWLAWEGLASPGLLIALTFGLGTIFAFATPAAQASLGTVVPRDELPGAASLNILGFNVARTLGPALGGLVVAAGGATAAFLSNLGAALAAVGLLLLWQPPAQAAGTGATMFGALAQGLRCVRDLPPLRAIVGRALAFTLSGSAVWALMPLVARDLVGGGARQFGFLLGALGFGAVLGAAASHEIRRRFAGETLVRAAALTFAAACLVVASRPGLAVTLACLVLGGAGWVQALSGFSVAGQIWAPRRLVGRVTAAVSMMTFGGIALGSWLWGHVAERFGIAFALGGSAAAMAAVAALGLLLPMPRPEADPR